MKVNQALSQRCRIITKHFHGFAKNRLKVTCVHDALLWYLYSLKFA